MAAIRGQSSFLSRWAAALCLAILALASAPSSAWAIDPASIAWRPLGGEQGFAGGAVRSMAQDSRGLVWVGAGDGLYRYDGQGFAFFRPDTWGGVLGAPSIYRILADGRNGIWIAASNGVLRYDTLAGEFRRARLADPPGERSTWIAALAIDQGGRVFAGAADGTVWTIDPEGLSGAVFAGPGMAGAAVSALEADTAGRVWVGTDGAGIALLDGAGRLLARHRAGGPDGPASNRVGTIMEDSLGFLWVGYADGGVDLCEAGRFRHARATSPGRGAPPAVSAMAEDQQGQIWVGLRDGGVGILDPSSMELSTYPFAEGREVSALLRDRRGLLWAGMRSGGLITGDFRSAGFQRLTTLPGGARIGAATALAAAPSGRLLAAGSSAGLLAFDAVAGNFAPAAPRNLTGGEGSAALGKIQAILPLEDGTTWLGTGGGGLIGLGPRGAPIPRVPGPRLASPYVLCLLGAENGKIWVGTEGGGLDLFDPRTGNVRHWGYAAGPAPPLPASFITCLYRDASGRTWAGTADAGLFVREPGGARFRPFGRGGRSKEGLGSLRVNVVLGDSRGRLWVGMGGGGLAAIDPRTETVVARAASAGLDDETVYGLAVDGEGILWVAGSRGFYGYDAQRGDLFRFGPEDGLSPGGYGAVLASGDGHIWLGGEGGFTRFDPARMSRYGLAPDVIVADVETPGGPASFRRSPERDEIRLGHDNAGLRFAIAAIDFSSAGRNRYAMMLEGHQSAWSDMGSMNAGYIAPLTPGHYMLRVRAANGNGVWNPYGASLAIVVSPPWWGTWWFRAAAAAAMALLAAGGIAAALGGLKRRNELLARFARHIEEAREEERSIAARDVHDEIGQHLMVLNFHAYWLARHPEAEASERAPVVAQLQKGILDAMAAVKVVATRLRPVGLDTLDFPDVLKYYVRSFDRMSGIRTSLDIGPDWKDMPADTAKAFFRLLQEMLSNVARHAKAKSAAVRFRREGETYLLEVEDDGVGIGAEAIGARDSFGIIGMREACAARGGALSFSSPPGGGSIVAARLPKAGEGAGRGRGARRKRAEGQGRLTEGR